MQIVWITPKWPFPVSDGARQATTQLLKNLTARGAKIHLLSIVPEEEETDPETARRILGVDGVTVVRRRLGKRLRKVWSLIRRPFFPVTLSPYAAASVAKGIERILAEKRPQLVVYDGLHSAAWRLSAPAGFPASVSEIYRAHNVESDLWFRAAGQTKNPVKKLLLAFQGLLVRRIESKLLRYTRHTFPVSSADEERFAERVEKTKLRTLPIGLPVPAKEPGFRPPKDLRRALFVGRLDWVPNREGLEWVLREVWPEVVSRVDDVVLRIVGAGDGSWLDAYRHLPRLEIVGLVDSVDSHYDESLITVVPIFYGSGTRVKAIESCLHAKACLSTEVGIEGIGLIPGKHYYPANDAEDWINTLVAFQPNHALELGLQAREYVRTAYDPGKVAENFMASVGLRPT